MSFVATNGPGQVKYKLTGQGAWKLDNNSLTVVPLAMSLENVSPKDLATLNPYIQAQVKVAQIGPLEWKGDDEFVLTKDGVKQDFKRVGD